MLPQQAASARTALEAAMLPTALHAAARTAAAGSSWTAHAQRAKVDLSSTSGRLDRGTGA
eukprot:861390-Pelagomonas_calceolata.AAC.2